jgi:SAM dependent carboxyl methyltransferase
VVPPSSVHVAWSAYAAMWISRIPVLIPGHFAFPRSTCAVRAQFEQQAAHDWQCFLRLRARELRPGGCLVLCVPSATPNSAHHSALA